MERLEFALRCLLAACCLALAGLKFYAGYEPTLSIPQWLYFSSASVELIASLLLFSPLRMHAAVSLTTLWLCGMVIGITHPSTDCGCLGKVVLTKDQHVALACILGILSCLVIRIGFRTNAPYAKEPT